MTETIQTARLYLEPFGESHLTPRYVGWLNDPAVIRYSEQRHRSHTLDSCRAYWESFAGTPHHFWAIVTRTPEPGHIGNLAAYVDEANRIAELSILVGEPSVQGQGLGTEAWQAACEFLWRRTNVRKITAGTLAPNLAMLGVMRKAGMVPDGRRQGHYLLEGRAVDVVYAALFREDWHQTKKEASR